MILAGIKALVWLAAFIAVVVAIMYGVWIVLVLMVFNQMTQMWLAIAGEFVLFGIYFLLIRLLK